MDYWAAMRESLSFMEKTFAIFANVVRLDADGAPLNARKRNVALLSGFANS
jgi:hypothetical protein